jgi:hypothetical protein
MGAQRDQPAQWYTGFELVGDSGNKTAVVPAHTFHEARSGS